MYDGKIIQAPLYQVSRIHIMGIEKNILGDKPQEDKLHGIVVANVGKTRAVLVKP
jgi:hypothetical protein